MAVSRATAGKCLWAAAMATWALRARCATAWCIPWPALRRRWPAAGCGGGRGSAGLRRCRRGARSAAAAANPGRGAPTATLNLHAQQKKAGQERTPDRPQHHYAAAETKPSARSDAARPRSPPPWMSSCPEGRASQPSQIKTGTETRHDTNPHEPARNAAHATDEKLRTNEDTTHLPNAKREATAERRSDGAGEQSHSPPAMAAFARRLRPGCI